MEKLVLRDYETFSEIPNGVLLVKNNSNVMYVRIARKAYIAREFIDKILTDDKNSTYMISYYNVKNNEKILTLEIEKNISNGNIEKTNQREDVDIIPLSEILNLKQNRIEFICLDDIDNLVDFKSEYIPGKKHSII